jgi:type II secretory pathway pseudopilin PulG
MRDNRIAESDEGFSLIETLVSLTLVIVTMGAVGSYLVGSFGYVAHQRGKQVALQLANNALGRV